MEEELKILIRHISRYIFPTAFMANADHEQVAVRGSLGVILSSFVDNAPQIMDLFNKELPELKRLILTDLEAIQRNDPAVESEKEVIFCYPGLKEMIYYRTAHILYQLGVPVLPRFITEQAHSITGIDIHPAAQIGEQFCIDHGTGIVIGATAIIGKGVTLYQGVTLGAKNFQHDAQGQPLDVPRHPILEDNVTVYSNTSILGRVRIGEDSVIGGNVWLTHDVPAGTRLLKNEE